MRPTLLTKNLTIHYPIVQAAMPGSDGLRLPAAVSNAGGLGTLALHAPSPSAVRARLERLRTLTTRSVLISFTAEWERPEVLEAALTLGFREFGVFWWNGPRLAPQIQRAGGSIFWHVGTDEQVEEAQEFSADVLILQGTEAGGQVRSPVSIYTLIQAVRARVGTNFPLIAGGGLADAQDVAAVLATGADAALLGTRFALSEESAIPRRQKLRLLRAESDALILDTRLVGNWPCAPRRRLPTLSEDDVPGLYAGLGLSKITRLSSAADLVRALSSACAV